MLSCKDPQLMCVDQWTRRQLVLEFISTNLAFMKEFQESKPFKKNPKDVLCSLSQAVKGKGQTF